VIHERRRTCANRIDEVGGVWQGYQEGADGVSVTTSGGIAGMTGYDVQSTVILELILRGFAGRG